MSFFGSLFTGQNKTLDQNLNTFGGIGGFGTSLGESNLGQSSKFWSNILSGNSAKIAQSLSPEISAQQGQLQQGEKTASEFHNRGGGVNSSIQSGMGAARGNITNLVGGLQSGAASNLASSGSNLLSQGMEAYGEQSQLSEEQMQNWAGSLFGGALTGAAAIGLGAAGKSAGLGAGFFTGG